MPDFLRVLIGIIVFAAVARELTWLARCLLRWLGLCPSCGFRSAPNGKCKACGQVYLGATAPVDSNAIYTMKGVQDVLAVFEDKVTITPHGVWGFLNKGIKGTKEIPFVSIVAIQFKEAGAVFSGYLQFTIPGGNEITGGILAAMADENTFAFAPKDNSLAKEIKEYIDLAVRNLRSRPESAPREVFQMS